MKRVFRYFILMHILMVALCLCTRATGQEEYEDLLEAEGETSDQSELLERMAELKKNPLDLNAASTTELQRIPWLSPLQARKIVKHREEFGPFRSVSDLLGVSGIDEELFDKIASFFLVNAKRVFPPLSGRLRTRIIHGGSAEEIEGNQFLLKEKVYTRSEVSISDRVTIRVLTEKDAGEKYLNDHTICSLSIERWHVFDRVLFGNYRLGFGQGLVLGEYSGASKGASFPSSLKKRERGVGANTSTSEAGPFFGIAGSGSGRGFRFSLFGSQAKVDATLNSDNTVSSIYESGYHRTAAEQRKKDVLQENMFGTHISYGQGGWGNVGFTFYHSMYDRSFDSKDRGRKHFDFRGRANSVGGVNFDVYYRHLNIFGEAAVVGGSGTGILVGAFIDFDKIVVHTLVREYARDFYNLHNYAFAEKPDEVQNESGALLGIVHKPNSRVTLKAYIDRLRNPWRRYYEKMPPSREEFWSQIEYKVVQNVLSTLRIRLKNKETNKKMGDDESRNTRRQQTNARAQFDWKFSKRGRFRGRGENVWVKYPDLSVSEAGWILFGDLGLFPMKWITLNNRFILFRTDSYDSRIYEFENDLPGLMTNLGFYGGGMRWYVLTRAKLGRTARISFKYSITRFNESDKEDDHRFGIQFEFTSVF